MFPERAFPLLNPLDPPQLLLDSPLLPLHLLLLGLVERGELLDEVLVLGVAYLEVSVDDRGFADDLDSGVLLAVGLLERAVDL